MQRLGGSLRTTVPGCLIIRTPKGQGPLVLRNLNPYVKAKDTHEDYESGFAEKYLQVRCLFVCVCVVFSVLWVRRECND